MAISSKQLCKYSTLLRSLLGSGRRATIEILLETVFSMWSAPRLYYSTDQDDLLQRSGVEWRDLVGE
jgi:hypothetical protein